LETRESINLSRAAKVLENSKASTRKKGQKTKENKLRRSPNE
jgi:hypothetical protein